MATGALAARALAIITAFLRPTSLLLFAVLLRFDFPLGQEHLVEPVNTRVPDHHEAELVAMSSLDPLEERFDLALDEDSVGAVANGQLPERLLVAD